VPIPAGTICGAVAEWSKALAWKVSIRQNRIEGSNPSRSATWSVSPRRTPACPLNRRDSAPLSNQSVAPRVELSLLCRKFDAEFSGRSLASTLSPFGCELNGRTGKIPGNRKSRTPFATVLRGESARFGQISGVSTAKITGNFDRLWRYKIAIGGPLACLSDRATVMWPRRALVRWYRAPCALPMALSEQMHEALSRSR
jgi:hypothetical protein